MPTRPPLSHRAATVPVAVVLGSVLLAPVLPPAVATPSDPPGSAPTPTSAATQVQAPVPQIHWAGCGAGLEGLECASVPVPTDYDDPDGPTTSIALTRLPARDPDRRIGTLFTNPGGPGLSGVDLVQALGDTMFDDEVHDRFDVVGFDPRGVHRSDPATCYDSLEQETAVLTARRVPAFPTTAAEEKRYTSEQLRFAAACRQQSGDRFAHGSTANLARDMDLLRQAVGDEQLTYSGYSYGTMLGATYSMLFPDRVRALSLDGTWLPQDYTGEVAGEDTSVGVRLGQAAGAEETFTEFLRLCAEAGPGACSLAGLGDPTEVVEEMLERLRTEPVTITPPEGPAGEVTYASAVTRIFTGLYDHQSYPELADELTLVATAQSDSAPSPTPVGTSSERTPGSQEASPRPRRGVDYVSVGKDQVTLCADSGSTGRPFDYPDIAAQQDAEVPHFGALRTWLGFPCEFLQRPDADAYTGPWEQEVQTPVLVVGTRFDPGTPYDATQGFADLYPDASVLTIEGWGHLALGKSSCADAVLADYLIDLQTPAEGATCTQDRSPFATAPGR